MNEQLALENLNTIGEQYTKNLSESNPGVNWWNGLDFFFDRSFNRGRRDELSRKYKTFTIEVLKDRYQIELGDIENSYKLLLDDLNEGFLDKSIILIFKNKYNINFKSNSIKEKYFIEEVANNNPLIRTFIIKQKISVDYTDFGREKQFEEVFLGNDKDILMVLDTLKFISKNQPNNIYQFIYNSIQKIGADKTFDLITNKDTGIAYIGDKLGAFIIRDIVLMNPSLIENQEVNYEMMFPVDTWVSKIYKKLTHTPINVKVSNKKIKLYFIKKCQQYSYSPPKIAAGLWYLSFISLDLLVDGLDKINCLII